MDAYARDVAADHASAAAAATAAAAVSAAACDQQYLLQLQEGLLTYVTGGMRHADAALLLLSDTYALARQAIAVASAAAAADGDSGQQQQQGATAAADAAAVTWKPPEEFARKTDKFWVDPSQLMRFKTAVARHLPILVFGRPAVSTPEQLLQAAADAEAAAAADALPRSESKISSVYYDNPDQLVAYHARLARDDGASVVRIRWYGERVEGNTEQPLFVERKVHREAWSGEKSVKERTAIAQGMVGAYVQGVVPPQMMATADRRRRPRGGEDRITGDSPRGTSPTSGPKYERKVKLLSDVQDFLVASGQVPVCRTQCMRTAWQESTTNAVRISLDTQLCMVRETQRHSPLQEPMAWCRPEDAAADVVHVPYGVVEIKLTLEEGQAPPAWVAQLLASGLLVPAPKFSKFLHGMTLLYPDRVRNTPHWFVPVTAPAAVGADGRQAQEEVVIGSRCADIREMAEIAAKKKAEKGAWKAEAAGSGSGDDAAAADAAKSASSGGAAGEASLPARGLRILTVVSNRTATPDRADGGSAPSGATSSHNGSGSGGSSDRSDQSRSSSQSPPCVTGQQQGAVPQHAAVAAAGAAAYVSGVTQSRQPDGPLKPAALPAAAAAASCWDIESGQPLLASNQADDTTNAFLRTGGARDSASGGLNFFWPKGSSRVSAAGGPVLPPGSDGVVRALPVTRGGRVNPKIFFAAERTFLAWISVSVLIMVLGMSLLGNNSGTVGGAGVGMPSSGGTGDSSLSCADSRLCMANKIAGAIITPISILFMIYALYVYRWRSVALAARDVVASDMLGPVLLTVLLVGAVLTAYGLTLHTSLVV